MTSILVIDDEKVLLTMFTKVFERVGYHVLTTDNGTEGISLFHKESPDIVVTDVIMPDLCGNEIAHYIKRSVNSSVPVIGITGTPWAADKTLYNAVLSKPCSVNELAGVVKTMIGGQALNGNHI